MSKLDSVFEFYQPLFESDPSARQQFLELSALPSHLLPIVVGALLDSRLSQLCRARLLDWPGVDELLGGTGSGLNYATKVRLAVSVGVIPVDVSTMFLGIGRLRNHFAHHPAPSFEEPLVKKILVKTVNDPNREIMRRNGFNNAEIREAELEVIEQYGSDPERFGRELLYFIWLMFEYGTTNLAQKIVRLEPVEDLEFF